MTPAAYPRVALHNGLRRFEGSRIRFRKCRSASRAGSPLLFGLAPRGVFPASGVTTGAVGSYPTVSPLPNETSILEDVSQVSLRDATVLLRRRSGFCGTFREPFDQREANLAPAKLLPRRYLARCPLP